MSKESKRDLLFIYKGLQSILKKMQNIIKTLVFFTCLILAMKKNMNGEDLNPWLIDNFDKNMLFGFEILSIFYFCTQRLKGSIFVLVTNLK